MFTIEEMLADGFTPPLKSDTRALLQGLADSAAGGGLTDTQLRATPVPVLPSKTATVDQGVLFLVPAGTTNGTVLPDRPATTDGFTLYLGDAEVVTGYFQAVGFTPSGAPANAIAYGPYDGGAIIDVPQASRARTFFVTALTGTPKAIWVQK